MNVINVSYIYSLTEFYALLHLTGCSGIPFFAQEGISLFAGLEELKTNFLANQVGQTVTLDKLSAFLAQTVGRCSQCLCIRGQAYFLGLFYSDAATIVLYRQGQRWVVTPCQQFDDGLERLIQTLSTVPGKAEVCAKTSQGSWSRLYSEAENLLEAICLAAHWVQKNEAPSGKDSELWKR